ncbi:hypothetical protein [Lacrimispora sp. 38-1]|uniref:hypothetical protein n=1 Tax=Lacrimispora sp. 38-1 TaxID=3125778 RepID=UPI003CF10C07
MDQIEEMKAMIREEIQSITNLEERIVFKNLMEGVFLELYETNVQMYRMLEERVMNDLVYDVNRYLIRTGIMERGYLDNSHHLMSPICESDLETQVFEISEVRKKLEEEGRFCLTTVFLRCDAMEVEEVLKNQDNFTGRLKAGEEYPVSISLEPSRRYRQELEHLYHLFMKNGIPWKTINAPYLFKMADICITSLPEEISDDEVITSFGADFGEYNQFVQYDMIPIWNVRHLKLESVGFPVACSDHENYEHVISIRDYGTDHAYLVEEKAGIRSVRQSGEKLLVTGKIANAKKWDVFMIRSGSDQKIDRYTYPVMENLRKDGFAERFQEKTRQMVKTKGELERFIRGFGLEEFIEYKDCALLEQNQENLETYPMNFFMEDEIRDRSGKKRLVIYFKARGREKWLLRDLASFITSEVQELYPEYECGGKLI